RAFCTYTVYIIDSTAPWLVTPEDATYECDEEIIWDAASATDNCQENVLVTEGEPYYIWGDCPQEYTVIRYFMADDGCGNVSYGSQTISVVDTTAPVFDDYPVEVWVECDEVENVPVPTATDNCDLEVEVTYTSEIGSGGCLGILVRYLTATDDCGNSATAEQYIYIMDTTPPVINEPEDMTVQCDDVPEAPGEEGAEIYDNCGHEVEVDFHTEWIEGPCEDSYTILWIWDAMDICENWSHDTTVINVIDTTAPTLEVGQGGSYSCDEEIVYDEPSATDNCDELVDISSEVDTIWGNCPYSYTIVISYLATDNCGNTATGATTYVVYDETSPTFTSIPEDETIECDEEVPASEATAEDNCGMVTVTQSDFWYYESLCYSHIIRTFVATDECNNSSTATQNIYIYDTEAPVITGESEIEIPCEEFDENEGIYVDATDNCNEYWIVIDSTLQVSGECAGVYMRYYSAWDICENHSEQFIQIIYLTDEIAPVGNEPDDIEVLCSDEIPSFDPEFTDNCGGEVNVEYIGFEVTDICSVTYTEYWIATDNCGNETTIDRNVTIYDNVDPWFYTFPEDMTINCHDELPEVVNPIAMDNCDTEVAIELDIEELPGDCPQESTIYRTFRGYDNCGNQVVQTQTISIIDIYAPVFDELNEYSYEYECDEEAEVIQPAAMDNCGEITYTYLDTNYYSVECFESFDRIWTATDECGNSNTFWQYIYFIDTTPPVITGEPFIEISCEEFSLNEGVFVTAEDNCNESWVVIDSTLQVSGECGGVYLRYYTAYDICQNASEQFLQIITVIDTEAPTVDAEPEDMAYECDEEWVPASPVFSDNCDTELDLFPDLFFETDGCTSTYHYIWIAVDNCDNATTVDQIITVSDYTAPTVYWAPEDQTVECGNEWSVSDPIFLDNCDQDLDIESGSSDEWIECDHIYTYWWTATDECDHSTTVTVVVTIEDNTAPNIDAPQGGWFSCDEQIEYGWPEAWDVCDEEVDVTYQDDTLAGECPQSYTIIRTWYATDDCNNMSYDITEYNVYDDEAPTFTEVPEDITVECDEEIPATTASAVDNCGEVTVEYSDSDIQQDECDGYIIRTFVATDECGNWHSYDQIIDIIDTTPPTLIMPDPNSATMPCEEVFYAYYATWANGEATEEQLAAAQALFAQFGLLPVGVDDNCDPEAYWLETGIDVTVDVECPMVAMITCTFTPYDNCGNAGESQEAYIYVVDETAPTLVNPVDDEFIECDEEDMGWEPIFDDECNDDITVFPASSIETDGCTTIIHKSWTAYDPCGNEITVVHNITITDYTDPVVIAPEDATYNCYEEFEFANAEISDNCDEDLDIVVEDTMEEGDCPAEYTITRTWTATDNCGNSSSDSASITVVDHDAPFFTETPNDITIECDQEIPASEATADDYCSTVEVTQSDFWYYESPCYSIVYRTFVATDACGNWSDYVQVIYIEDTTGPVISGEASISIPCEEFDLNEGIYVTAEDNCNESFIYIDGTEQVSGECGGVYMRTYIAYDYCQNTSEPFLQIIHLTDDVAPVGNEPEDITISCDETAPNFDPEWTDNCYGELTYSHTLPTVFGYCNVSYTETWTATDNCGNMSSVDRIVTIVDEVNPTILSQDMEITIPCDETYEFVTPYAYDNCDLQVDVIGEYSSEEGECPGEYTETMVYTAYDECDNTSSVTYVVHHEDNQAPVVYDVAQDEWRECDETWSIADPSYYDNCSQATLVSDMYVLEGNCPNNYTEVYWWYAYDECGNYSDTYYTYVNVYDETDPTFDTEPSNESYECIDWDTYSVQVLTASDNCGPAEVTYDIEEEESDNCGNGIWWVYYTATDLCGNQSFTYYTISVYDETAPVLSEYPADLVIDCLDEVPGAPDITATDNCDEVDVWYTDDCYGDCPEEGQENSCDMVQPDLGTNECNYLYDGEPAPWSMALFSLGNNNFRYYLLDESYAGNSFVVNGDGTIDVTCRVVSCYDEEGGFDISVSFEDEMTWAEWSTQSFPTSFKADCGGEAANHEDWLYYLLANSEGAEVIGWGSFAGSSLSVVHAPANNYFGFQYGDGANNLSGGTGLGGWFTYNGTFLHNGEPINNNNGTVSGAGDFAWELDCCPDYYVVRCWSATDCTGNTTEWCQTISFADLDEDVPGIAHNDEPAQALGGIQIVSVQPNPANEKSTISFTSELDGKLSLQVMDMTGRVVADLFNNQVEANLVYRADFNAITLESGMYMIRLSNGTEQQVERIQVIR
ncbi:MAG: T9SS type A sorting domain-containing protein, partial [Flavobacteriales bacterium]